MTQATQRVKKYELDMSELDRRVEAALGGIDPAALSERLSASIAPVTPGSIVKARVDSVDQRSGMVVLDIGGKSEGSIPISEFGDKLPETGETYEVFYDGLGEDEQRWLDSPAEIADRTEARIYGVLLDVDDETYDQYARPMVEALRALPEPTRPREHVGRHRVFVLEPM